MTHTTTRPALAVLGMGNMGRALAERLLDANFVVSIWNRSDRDIPALSDKGAQRLSSLAHIWESAEVALTFLAHDEALREVCLGSEGILTSPREGRCLIDMSTVSPSISREVAAAARRAGIAYLRCPVSGNPSVLASGHLTIIASGPESAYHTQLSLLQAIGQKVLYVGEGEEARLVKLAINAGLAITTELMAELVILVEKHGMERSVFLDVLGESVLGSPFVKYKTTNLLSRNYVATFTTDLLAKDLRLALALAQDVDLTLPAVQLISTLVEEAAIGYGAADFAALLPHLQRAHGDTPDIPPSMDE